MSFALPSQRLSERALSPPPLDAIGRDGARDVLPNWAHEFGLRFCARRNLGIEGDTGKGAVESRARDPTRFGERPQRVDEFAKGCLMRPGGCVTRSRAGRKRGGGQSKGDHQGAQERKTCAPEGTRLALAAEVWP